MEEVCEHAPPRTSPLPSTVRMAVSVAFAQAADDVADAMDDLHENQKQDLRDTVLEDIGEAITGGTTARAIR